MNVSARAVPGFARGVRARLAKTGTWPQAGRYGAAALLGALSALAQAPFGLVPVLLIAFPGLFFLLEGAASSRHPMRQGFLTAWAFGFGAAALGMYWVAFAFLVQAEEFAWMIPVLVPGLMAILGLFAGLCGALTVLLWRTPPFGRDAMTKALILAGTWSLAEFMRGTLFTGLPWNLTAQAAIGILPMAQALSLIGPYGLGLVLAALALMPAVALAAPSPRPAFLVFSLGLGTLLTFGAVRLAAPAPEASGVHVVLVQPSVPQRDKLDPDKQVQNLLRMLDMTEEAAKAAPRRGEAIYAVWPENAYPFLDRQPGIAEGLAARFPPEMRLVTGSVRAWEEGEDVLYGNSVAVFGATEDARKPLLRVYDKHHLVPFGEYLPGASLFDALGLATLSPVGAGGFTPGAGPAVIEAGPAPFAPLVCYEGIFPGQIYPAGQRPDWLVTVTNDAWFGDGAGPKQHLAIARMRSIETGLPMARSANTGISALIDADGRVLEALRLYRPGTISAALPGARQTTVYDRIGELGWAFLLLLIVLPKKIRDLRGV